MHVGGGILSQTFNSLYQCPCPGCAKRPTIGRIQVESHGGYAEHLLSLPPPLNANVGSWRPFSGLSDKGKGRGLQVPVQGVEQAVIHGHHDSRWLMRRMRKEQ